MKKIQLIGYNCGWGAQKHGCADGPAALEKIELSDYISSLGFEASWAETYFSLIDEEDSNSNLLVHDYCYHLCEQVIQAIDKNIFPITIGGDHSMAVGTWSGVTNAWNCQDNFGLIWFDAHMDSHTPETSPSKAYHGMPLAVLLGHGDADHVNIGGNGRKINPKNVCLIGVRSFESEEAELLQKLGVKIFYMDDVRSQGMEKVINQALDIAKTDTAGYGVTIDLDAFDPSVAPGIGSPEKSGLLNKDLNAFSIFSNDAKIRAIEIAEYNPHLGKDGMTVKLIRDILRIMLT